MPSIIYDFNSSSESNDWLIINDGVMGGRSQSTFSIDADGNGVFTGTVSLENNGGFASVRHQNKRIEMDDLSNFVFRIKGDGKRYQFRVKTQKYDRHSYVTYFQTTGEWETINISFDSLVPTFRGRKLNMDNFQGKELAEIGFLIGNGTKESFRLEIDMVGIE